MTPEMDGLRRKIANKLCPPPFPSSTHCRVASCLEAAGYSHATRCMGKRWCLGARAERVRDQEAPYLHCQSSMSNPQGVQRWRKILGSDWKCKTVPFRQMPYKCHQRSKPINHGVQLLPSAASAKLQEAQMVRPNTRAWSRCGPWGSLLRRRFDENLDSMELFRSGTVRKPSPVRTYCPTALVKVVGVLWIWVEDKAKISVLQLGLRSWLYETLAQSNHQTSNLLGTSTGSKLHIISILSPYYLHIISICSLKPWMIRQ